MISNYSLVLCVIIKNIIGKFVTGTQISIAACVLCYITFIGTKIVEMINLEVLKKLREPLINFSGQGSIIA